MFLPYALHSDKSIKCESTLSKKDGSVACKRKSIEDPEGSIDCVKTKCIKTEDDGSAKTSHTTDIKECSLKVEDEKLAPTETTTHQDEFFIQMEKCYYHCLVQLKIQPSAIKENNDGTYTMKAYAGTGCTCICSEDNKLFKKVRCNCMPFNLYHLPLDHELVNYIHPDFINEVKVHRSEATDRMDYYVDGFERSLPKKGKLRMLHEFFLENHAGYYEKHILNRR